MREQRLSINRSLMFFDSIHTSVESRQTSAFKHLLPDGGVPGVAPEYVTFDKKQSNLWAYAESTVADNCGGMQMNKVSIDDNIRVSSSMARDDSVSKLSNNIKSLNEHVKQTRVGLVKYQEETLDEDELDQEGRACVEVVHEHLTKLKPLQNNFSAVMSSALSPEKGGTEDSGNLSMNYADEFGQAQIKDATLSKFAR